MKTLLAIGAHYDDCVFGVPGILLSAVRKHYRVVILTLIGDYSNWTAVKGRERELVGGTIRLARERGVEMRFLDFASHQFDDSLENKVKVAKVVAEIQPDIALALWSEDHHHDHVMASKLSRAALRHAGQILGNVAYRPPRNLFLYDNGPRHTIGFTPDTYVDVTDVWAESAQWLGQLMALMRNVPYDGAKLDTATRIKESIARYRGSASGVQYAEALWEGTARPIEIL